MEKLRYFQRFLHRKPWNVWKLFFENLLWDKWHIVKRGSTTRRAQTRFTSGEWKWSDVHSFYTCSTLTCWLGINCSVNDNVYGEMNSPSISKQMWTFCVPLENLGAIIFLLLSTQEWWKKKITIKNPIQPDANTRKKYFVISFERSTSLCIFSYENLIFSYFYPKSIFSFSLLKSLL